MPTIGITKPYTTKPYANSMRAATAILPQAASLTELLVGSSPTNRGPSNEEAEMRCRVDMAWQVGCRSRALFESVTRRHCCRHRTARQRQKWAVRGHEYKQQRRTQGCQHMAISSAGNVQHGAMPPTAQVCTLEAA